MKSDLQLRRAYLRFNRKYFGGRLPENCIVGWAKLKSCIVGEQIYFRSLARIIPDTPAIRIHYRLQNSRCFAMMTLLHEMCHLSVSPRAKAHGRAFQREMQRLSTIGAFCEWW